MTDDELNAAAEDAAQSGREEPTEPEAATEQEAATEPAAATAAAAGPVQYGIGPFSLRELILAGVWVVAFVVSFFSTSLIGFSSVWTRGLDWILAIGVPTVAVFLVVLRRLSPTGIRRVGSLGIDQFASVAFSVAVLVWLSPLWSQVGLAASGGPWVVSWVSWVEVVLMLAGVVLTVFAVLIPGLRDDFAHRPETIAHRFARPVRPVTARPRPEPAPIVPLEPAPAPAPAPEAAPEADIDRTMVLDQPVVAPEPSEEPQAPAHQAFWALVPEERDVVDESGATVFTIGPTAWALVIEDRGTSFVVRHEDGRLGFLNDVSGVTRG